MFDSIFTSTVSASQFFIMMGTSLIAGILFAWVLSFKVHSSRRFFTVCAILPFMVGAVICFVSGNIGVGVAVGGAFALIRFRSAQGSAEEIGAVLIAMGSGIAFGTGYVGYGVVILLVMCVIFMFLASSSIFEHTKGAQEKLLRITIPETLEYTDTFDDIFDHYLDHVESVGVKTTGMGSMFKLSFKIRMKDEAEEKAMIDEIRTKNGNLEISILPYTEPSGQL